MSGSGAAVVSRPVPLATYLVTDTGLCGPRGVVATVVAAVAGGVDVVQVRDKNADRRTLAALVADVLAAVGDRVPVIVDDAVDVAVLTGAHGAHVGQGDLDPRRARDLLGDGPLLGLSVGNRTELDAAHALPAGTVDHLGFSPVWSTPTKPDAPPPLGLAGLADLVAASRLPGVAIGGIDASRVAAVRATGVAGVAVVSAVCAAPDPAAAAAALAATALTATALAATARADARTRGADSTVAS